MLDILERHGYSVGATAVDARAPMIDGSPSTGRLADVMSANGVPRMYDRDFLKGDSQDLREYLEALHAETDHTSGVFGNEWSQSFVDIWNKTDSIVNVLRGTSLDTGFATPAATNIGGIASQMKMIARLIKIRNERGQGINRDAFYAEMGGYDSHFQVGTVLQNKLPSLNYAMESFWAEMKAQGIADSVVVVIGSEFGRTITPNSNAGSDHAWGGNVSMNSLVVDPRYWCRLTLALVSSTSCSEGMSRVAKSRESTPNHSVPPIRSISVAGAFSLQPAGMPCSTP